VLFTKKPVKEVNIFPKDTKIKQLLSHIIPLEEKWEQNNGELVEEGEVTELLTA
jgi:hypothetical protein